MLIGSAVYARRAGDVAPHLFGFLKLVPNAVEFSIERAGEIKDLVARQFRDSRFELLNLTQAALLVLSRALGAAAAEGDFDVVDLKCLGKFSGLKGAFLGNIDVEDLAADFAEEMPVFAHVWAKADRGAVEDDLADKPALDEQA
jgi:hypothetical protein